LDQALTARTLPGGIGPSHVTKFKDILGLFTIENGVASVGKFSLDGAGVLAEGAGQIDLGNQRIDFSLRPRLTGKSASDLAAFGIPIQVKGGFGNVKVGLDSDLLGQIVAERARSKAASLIKKEVGGGLGNIGSPEASSAPTGQDPVSTILGGILGSNQAPTNQQPQQQTPPSKKEEPKLEDALLSIFGGKKKGE